MTGWSEDGRYLRHTMLPSGMVFTIDETDFRRGSYSCQCMPPAPRSGRLKTPGELREKAAAEVLAVFRELGVLSGPAAGQSGRRLPRLPY